MAKNSFWEIVESDFVAGAQSGEMLPAPIMVEVAFAGRSNVGKSSLLNALMDRRNLVRTSSTPGCTRQINLFEAKARDQTVFHLIDLPGYGYAKRSKDERKTWGPMIEGYLAQRETLKAVVILVDVRRGVQEEEQQLLDFLATRTTPVAVFVVATKIDRIKKSKRKAVLSHLSAPKGASIHAVSATTRDGIGPLWIALRKGVGLVSEVAVPDETPSEDAAIPVATD